MKQSKRQERRREKERDERRKREECPYCLVRMDERWHHDTDWYGTLHYARCDRCRTTFINTTDGWEEAVLQERDDDG